MVGFLISLAVFAAVLLVLEGGFPSPHPSQISYTEFRQQISEGKAMGITLKGRQVTGLYRQPAQEKKTKEAVARKQPDRKD